MIRSWRLSLFISWNFFVVQHVSSISPVFGFIQHPTKATHFFLICHRTILFEAQFGLSSWIDCRCRIWKKYSPSQLTKKMIGFSFILVLFSSWLLYWFNFRHSEARFDGAQPQLASAPRDSISIDDDDDDEEAMEVDSHEHDWRFQQPPTTIPRLLTAGHYSIPSSSFVSKSTGFLFCTYRLVSLVFFRIEFRSDVWTVHSFHTQHPVK